MVNCSLTATPERFLSCEEYVCRSRKLLSPTCASPAHSISVLLGERGAYPMPQLIMLRWNFNLEAIGYISHLIQSKGVQVQQLATAQKGVFLPLTMITTTIQLRNCEREIRVGGHGGVKTYCLIRFIRVRFVLPLSTRTLVPTETQLNS